MIILPQLLRGQISYWCVNKNFAEFYYKFNNLRKIFINIWLETYHNGQWIINFRLISRYNGNLKAIYPIQSNIQNFEIF